MSGLAADLLVVAHLAFVAFVMAGGLLAWRWPRFAWVHLPAVAWGALIEFNGWICPLTPLEQRLRQAAGDEGYSGGFIEHYLLPALYPDGLTTAVQWLLGSLVLGVNAIVYGRLLWRRRQR